MNDQSPISVQTVVNAPIEKIWALWIEPEHITKWNSASDEWHTPHAENDLRPGGKFTSRMKAKDGSVGFDFAGIYDEVRENERIVYTMSDGRKVTIEFKAEGDKTTVIETFDPESENPRDMQQGGWQAILDNFKKYAEAAE
jgi:uncharacterized protein YndB with AHSA1/START domain